ncbi:MULTISPECIES: S1 RNA-binding domain-containing protein [Eisenbergiella]|uniref:S1 RNA-binding domain-containing protein n=1 Tax=Eisenbergiella massiliensis TaxID=1720294 RepID=A0A3E3J4I7_9FIRM|nr:MULTISPECIES: S1 RNA-binding domain-containing protein [Eisenbergiella]MBS7031535.1 S1 RNA-binding domain-containing protein [Clostridium sp.]MCI6707099.1 S1 RNA-binding domain-containing protein [Eisenbergiella massiliensis]MDY5528286.1 S1 RNA-binding domain-containing protein [Eisenbergiella porci]RGE64483.1 S1 RNA-binding domain-containing protein [Eisenbergiella massiliensis]RGE74234.1 S1 RNA-binding domain-containing protein [Eisenbergiella massiliensis]
MEDYAKELEASFRSIKEGDIITGTVIAVNEEGAILDLQYYAQGVIKAEDMSSDPNFNILEDVKTGDTIEATVVKTDDGEGNILLSKKEAVQVLAWDILKGYMDEKKSIQVKISEIVKAGAVAFVEGIRGFIPASQLSLTYVEDLEPWLGKQLEVRVITVDQEKNKLVLSAKAIEKEKAEAEINHKISMLAPGTILEGTVESLMPYGAFISLPEGLSGLVHISQISQRRIKKPSEVLNTGDKVKVKVLNTNDGKISLSMKAVEENTEADEMEAHQAEEYSSKEEATTSLGDLFKKLKL